MIKSYLKFNKYITNTSQMSKIHHLMENLSNNIFNRRYSMFKENYYIKILNCNDEYVNNYNQKKVDMLTKMINNFKKTNDVLLLNNYILPNLLLILRIKKKINNKIITDTKFDKLLEQL